MKTRAAWPFLLLCAPFLCASASAQPLHPTRMDRRAERPAAQAGLHGSSSTLRRAVVFPAGSTQNAFEFTFGVSSEQGHDFLKVYLDGVEKLSFSGTLSGRRRVAVPAPGMHVLKVEYVKDAAGSAGLDTAWIDDVIAYSSKGGIIDVHRFDTFAAGPPAGWTPGGAAGGFVLSAPPASMSAASPVGQGHGQSSSMQRSTIFPSVTGNRLSFNYFVDSEKADRLDVYVDNALQASVSGSMQAGSRSIPLATGGPHVIKFEYVKNGSVSAGLDRARVDNVVLRSGDQEFEIHSFDGYTGGAPPGWTAAGGWGLSATTPHVSYVPPQTVGQKWAPNFASFTEPTADGQVKQNEWKNPTRVHIVNYASVTGLPGGELSLVASKTSGKLYLALRAQGTTQKGGEAGNFEVWLDARRGETLRGLGCSAGPSLPRVEDRKLVVRYSIAPGATTGTATVAQLRGNCQSGAGAWTRLGSYPQWPSLVKVGEPAFDPGFVHIELEVSLPRDVLAENLLGLGARRVNTAGGVRAVERFSYHDDRVGPLGDNVLSWETVRLAYTEATPVPSERPWDACCFPSKSRPGRHW
ncbi:MAG TPA: hypothetical protein VN282_24475 [Pyrinomonadaceae bacterium]|nr:hypothetical protein [Pyrinomonadaceae bacterium]